MEKKPISRRRFLRNTSVTATAMTFGRDVLARPKKSPFDPKGLPTRELGKTGSRVPRIGIGTGSCFCKVKDEDKALELLTHALDHGLYYWDTAHDYVFFGVTSEERLGKILKHRRREVFLSTKVRSREPDEARRHIDESLKRLQTDYLDILKVHSLTSVKDAQQLGKKGGVLDVLRKLRDEGVVKNIGFTGHTSAQAMALAAKKYDFKTMLIALNHYKAGREEFEREAVPEAARRGLGVVVMKVIRPREKAKNITGRDLVRYALSLEHVTSAVIGIDTLDTLKENIALLKNFKPMGKKEREKMRVALAPFFRGDGLEWMQAPYRDGHWA